MDAEVKKVNTEGDLESQTESNQAKEQSDYLFNARAVVANLQVVNVEVLDAAKAGEVDTDCREFGKNFVSRGG